MKNTDNIFETGVAPNLSKKELPATSLGRTCRFDEGDKPTVCSKYKTGNKKSDTPEGMLGTKNSQDQLSIGDQSGHWPDLRDRTHQ